jgi:sugar phosphate isomerase/epimerase
MTKVALSTIACPEWTLSRVARFAAEHEFDGVEFRSFGEGSTRFANDPGLTDAAKVASVLRRHGVEPAGLATGLRFDHAIIPPVLGYLLPTSGSDVREAFHMVELAQRVGARFVRVFPFAVPEVPLEGRHGTVKRIASRLTQVCDHCRHRDTFIVLENGGDFATADDLLEIIARVNSPYLLACYDLFAATQVQDDIEAGVRKLGPRLAIARLRDRRLADGDDAGPTPLGAGDLPAEGFVKTLATVDFDGWLVYEWERAWLEGLDPADSALPTALRTIHRWLNEAATPGDDAAPAGAIAAA